MLDEKLFHRVPRYLISAIGMGVTTWFVMHGLDDRYLTGNMWFKVCGLTFIIGASCLVYGLMLQITGALKWRELLTTFKRPRNF